jgi:hypothetical protein
MECNLVQIEYVWFATEAVLMIKVTLQIEIQK